MIRARVLAVSAVLALVFLGAASAARFIVGAGTLSAFDYSAHIELPTLVAVVNVVPKTLERKSKGEHVSAFVSLPDGFDPGAVDISSVKLCVGSAPFNGCAAAEGARMVGARLKADFDRAAVLALVAGLPVPSSVTVTVLGLVGPSAIAWAGTDTVTVIGSPAP